MKQFSPLNKEEKNIINEVVKIINNSILIPFTDCKYCVEGCPKNIAIPEYFSLYNTAKQTSSDVFSTQEIYYKKLTQSYGKASDCIACKKCEKNCPQHIDITKYLKEIAKVFELKK